jgi:hypothetical protein
MIRVEVEFMPAEPVETEWMAVVGKALAYFCLQDVIVKDASRVSTLLGKMNFLEGLGIPKNDAAAMLGTTTNSVGVLERRKLKGEARGKKAKRPRR